MDLVFAENDGDERLTITATSSDDDGSVAVNSYMFVYVDENGVEQVEATHQGFSIDSNGVITIASPLNYEETSSYDLRIRATDANGEEADLSITISVQNVQEGPAEYDIRENQAGTMLSVALLMLTLILLLFQKTLMGVLARLVSNGSPPPMVARPKTILQALLTRPRRRLI